MLLLPQPAMAAGQALSPVPGMTRSARTCTANWKSSASTIPSSPRSKSLQTAATFCAIQPPHDFPLYFYGRFPTAPDLQIQADELDTDAIREAQIFWSTVTGLCQEPSREAHIKAHEARPRTSLKPGQYTILDLDYRPMFWESEEEAREQVARILPHVTVAIGNDQECAVAVGPGHSG
jgi:5-dehydro-2-deoxygluconokinase